MGLYSILPQDGDDQLSFDYNQTYNSPLSTTYNITGNVTASLPTTMSTTNITYGGTTSATVSITGAGGGGGGWITSSNLSPTYTISAGDTYAYANAWGVNKTLKVYGDAEFNGDLKVGGVSLTERLDQIEQRLGILRPNNDLEGKWEKLKKLGEEYRAMEKEILEQEKIWDILKK
jgi:hypothetical protein